jgi:hypothetical protein
MAIRLSVAGVLFAVEVIAATALSEPIGSQVRISRAGRDGNPNLQRGQFGRRLQHADEPVSGRVGGR